MGRGTILHVEDDSNDVMLLQHACKRAGLKVDIQAVDDGDEAIAYLGGAKQFADREQFPLPHLVLLDLKMPRVNGFEVLAWMRQNERIRCVPAVVLTSSNHEADIRRAYDLGANSYLVKPVGFDGLVDLVRSLSQYWLTLNQLPDL